MKKKEKTDGVAIPQSIEENAAPEQSGSVSRQSGALKHGESHRSGLSNKGSNTNMASKKSSGYASSFLAGTEKAVEEFAVIHLIETDTEFVLKMPSLVAASDVREVSLVDDKNAHYDSVIASHKNPDLFVSKAMQSINNPTKNQNEMTAPQALRDSGCQASSYAILDAVRSQETTAAETDHTISDSGVNTDITELDDSAGVSPYVKKFVGDSLSVALVSHGCLLDTTSVSKPEPPPESRAAETHKKAEGPKASSKRSKSSTGAGAMSSGAGDGSIAGGGSSGVVASTGDNTGMSGPYQQATGSQDGLSGGTSGVGGGGMHGGMSTAGDGSGGGGGDDRVEYVEQDSLQVLREKQASSIMASKSLLKKLQLVERAVQQNAYHKEHLDYRNLPEIQPIQLGTSDRANVVESADQLFGGLGLGKTMAAAAVPAVPATTVPDGDGEEDGEDDTAAKPETDTEQAAEAAAMESKLGREVHNGVNSQYVRKLFSWANIDLVRGRAVTAIAANTANCDVMAVGYGKLDTIPNEEAENENGKTYGGLVLFWSLRNPDYPEKILRTPFPVTALSFSKLSPTLIAVGLYSGELMIYDVKRESDWGTPMESSQNMTGGHSDPIWDLKWIMKPAERVETLVSISTDGNVLQWSLKKGLVVSTLMQLKRGGVGEGWISRTAAGLCFDFLPEDCTRYVTGTEEGSVHLSNVSHNEQYLDTYESQNGPVYRTVFSKAWPEIFLTCSADWTMGLYHVRLRAPVLKFHTTGADFAVNDVCWCPGNSSVFAAVSADAKIQLWDLNNSCIDPVTIIDTNADPALWAAGGFMPAAAKEAGKAKEGDSDDEFDAPPPVPPPQLHRPNAVQQKVDDDTPVHKLLKNLQAMQQTKRSLTTVVFSEHSPILIVGDSRGVVTLYRVLKPNAVTNETKVEKSHKLRQAILRQADPVTAAKLVAFETSGK